MKVLTEKYVEDVLRTEPSVEDYKKIIARIGIKEIRLLHAAMGLVTEAGEFMDQIKKHMMYGVPLDEINLIEELGDGNWYEGIALDTLMFSFAEVLHRNIAKLKKRFPEKFNEENAVNRDLNNERKILENSESVHYIVDDTSACGISIDLIGVRNLTSLPQKVTCPRCKGEEVFKYVHDSK